MTTSSPHIQAAALRAAFPGYVVNVLARQGEKPRFELVSRDGGSPYCRIMNGGSPVVPAARSPASRSGRAAARQPGPGQRLRR